MSFRTAGDGYTGEMADDRREPTKDETEQREQEERERSDEKKPKEGEPWAKIGSGDTESITSDE